MFESGTPDLDALAAGDVRRWAEFDVSVRRSWWPVGVLHTPREALAIAACSGDGHLREAAVSRLAVSPDPEALPLLLIRCVDWVRPIRELARPLVLSELDETALRAMLPLIGVLRRRQVDDWMTMLFRRALTPELVEDALALADRESRRWVHAEATGLLPSARLWEIAARDKDFHVRTLCGNALLDRGEFVGDLLAAGPPKVRMRALTFADRTMVEAHLADRTSAVRSMAQSLVLKAGGDPAEHYRAMPLSAGAIAGLGECGTAADAERLERHLADERPRIRALAVRGLRRVAPESNAVEPLLTDPSPAVTRQVVAFLRGRSLDVPMLQDLLFAERPLHTRRAAAALLRGQGGWTRLHTDLVLVAAPEDPLAVEAHRDLYAWLAEATGLYTKPPVGWRAAMEAAFDLLAPAPARELRFALGFRN